MVRLCLITSLTLGLWSLGASRALAAPGSFVEAEVNLVWSRGGDDGSQYGWAIADLEDVNGDGVRDLAVGAPSASGVDGPAGLVDVLSGADGSLLWSAPGMAGDQLGYALADAGDVDADGTTDVVIGAPGSDGGAGRVDILSGVDGELLFSSPSPEPGARFGSAVASGGGLDADEFADWIVGGEAARGLKDEPQAGAIWAFAGADGGALWSHRGRAGSRMGSGAAWVGDHNRDGVDDPFVGARDGGDAQRGLARILDGATGETLLELSPDEQGGDFGWFFVASVGDLDDDGRSDLYVGDFSSNAAGAGSGRVHVFSASDGSAIHTIDGSPSDGLGPGRGAGDVNFDGVPDLLVGAYTHSTGAAGGGRAYVFSGGDGRILRTITSAEPGEQLGFDAIGLGDVDGDRTIDLAISAARGNYVYVVGGIEAPGGDDTGSSTSGRPRIDVGSPPNDDSGPASTTVSPPDSSGPSTTTSPPPASTSTTAPPSSTEPASTAATDGNAGSNDESGCGCSSPAPTAGLGWLIGLVLLRRRRR